MDQMGMIQLFLIAKGMRDYFQTSQSEGFDFFFFLITSWACGKGQGELKQNCISQHNLGTGLPSAWEDWLSTVQSCQAGSSATFTSFASRLKGDDQQLEKEKYSCTEEIFLLTITQRPFSIFAVKLGIGSPQDTGVLISLTVCCT